MDPHHHLPIPEIAPHALLRDRTALDPAALAQLQHSIATEGLRSPIGIRNHVSVVEGLGPLLTTPTELTIRQLDTIAAAIQSGHEDILAATLHPVAGQSLETQWTTLRPVLSDVLREPTNPTTRRPRRLLHLRQGLTITREATPGGFTLRFTGAQAKSGLIDDVLDKVEQWFSKD